MGVLFRVWVLKSKLFHRDEGARENIDTLDNEAFFFSFSQPVTRPWSKFISRTQLPSTIKPRCVCSHWHSVFSLANRWYRHEDPNHFCVSSPFGHPVWCATNRDHRRCPARNISQVSYNYYSYFIHIKISINYKKLSHCVKITIIFCKKFDIFSRLKQ